MSQAVQVPVNGKRRQPRFTPMREEANCLGRSCNDRENCMRYRRHAALVGQVWATFDIERQAHSGQCPGFTSLSEGR